MSNDNKLKEGLTKVVEFFKEITENSNDPVKHCKVYLEQGCSHVDGYLCKMSACNILAEYKGLSTIQQLKVGLSNKEINIPAMFQLLEILQDEMETQKQVNITLADQYKTVGYLSTVDKEQPLHPVADMQMHWIPVLADKRDEASALAIIDNIGK